MTDSAKTRTEKSNKTKKTKSKLRILIFIGCVILGLVGGYILGQPQKPKYIEAPTKTYHSSSTDKQG